LSSQFKIQNEELKTFSFRLRLLTQLCNIKLSLDLLQHGFQLMLFPEFFVEARR
jgi:hypothetical protein